MTLPSDFIEGDLPKEFEGLIIHDVTALDGEWLESPDKPLDDVIPILSRLGLSGVKTKVLSRTSCKVEITLVNKDSPLAAESNALSPSTVTPSADNTPPTNRGERQAGESPRNRQDMGYPEWQQTQYFPMGRTRTVKFVSDGITQYEQFEPDTSTTWLQKSVWYNGKLIQRRVNDDLGLVMYDTRCVLRQRPGSEPSGQGSLEPKRVQAFQWKLVDSNTDSVLSCILYLDPLSSD